MKVDGDAEAYCKARREEAFTMQVKDLPERPQLHGVRLPEQKRVLKGHIRKVQGLSWGADSRTLIAADQGGKTIIWDAFRGMKMKVISKPFTVAVAKHPTRELAATGGMDNVVSVWSTAGEDAECSLTRELEYHEGYISSLAFVGEDMMLSSSGDAEIVLWDLMTLKTKRTFLGHDGDASCIRFPAGQSDHRAFCTGSSDGTVRVWDLRSSACTHKFDVAAEVNGCAFFPSGTAVAAAAHNGCTFLFDLRSQAPLQKYSRKNNHAAAVDFSLSGRTMYVAYEDGHVCLWDPLASSENGYVQKLPAHVKTPNNDPRMRTISCMSMSPDGTALATGAFDSLIKIWGPAPAEPRASSPQA